MHDIFHKHMYVFPRILVSNYLMTLCECYWHCQIKYNKYNNMSWTVTVQERPSLTESGQHLVLCAQYSSVAWISWVPCDKSTNEKHFFNLTFAWYFRISFLGTQPGLEPDKAQPKPGLWAQAGPGTSLETAHYTEKVGRHWKRWRNRVLVLHDGSDPSLETRST
jgi:hypothetical protein